MDAGYEVVDGQDEGVERDDANVEGEEDEELLVLLPDAVVDPRAVVGHLLDAPVEIEIRQWLFWNNPYSNNT